MRRRTLFLLVQKDLLRHRRSPLAILALIAFPLIFSTMLALAFGGGDSEFPRARLLVEDLDDGMAGGFIKSFLGSDQVSDFLEVIVVGAEGAQMMERGDASALLRIPAGLTEKLLDGEPAALELVRNPAQGILPEVAETTTAILADVVSLVAGLLRQQIETLDLTSIDSIDDVKDDDFGRISVALRHAFEKIGTYLSAPPLELEIATLSEESAPEKDGGDSSTLNIFLFILPGISVYSLFLIGDQTLRDVLVESRLGTLRRQLSAPVSTGEVIASKVLVTAAVAGIVLLILSAIAAGLAARPVNLLAFALLSLALVLSVTGFATVIYSVAKTENQGSTFAGIFYLVLAFSGGSFIQVEGLPAVLRAVAPLSPFYWGTQGFRRLLDDAAFAGVVEPVAVLASSGLVLLVLGSFLLQRKVLRGEAA